MKKIYSFLLIFIGLLILVGCGNAKSPEDYQKALDSIEFSFDINNINDNVVLPGKTKKFDLDILWNYKKIDSEEEGYKADCGTIDMNDGKATLLNKLEYDGDYEKRNFGRITLIALVMDNDGNSYVKEFVATIYEKIPSLDYTIAKIKEYCAKEKQTYVETKATLVWINEIDNDRYNFIIYKGNEYIFVNNAFYNDKYNLKIGDEVYVKGVSDKFNGYPIITNNDNHDCTVELIKKGTYQYNPIEMDYNDFSKIKDTDGSIYLNVVKFNAIIKANDSSSDYSYHIEGTKNKELVVNVSNYSFISNNINNDRSAKRSIDKVVGKEISITGFIFINIDGVWEIIIVPSELK